MQELSQLPDNDVTAEYVDAMAAAVQEYGTPNAIVLFVVQPGEKNSYDQQVRPASALLLRNSPQHSALLLRNSPALLMRNLPQHSARLFSYTGLWKVSPFGYRNMPQTTEPICDMTFTWRIRCPEPNNATLLATTHASQRFVSTDLVFEAALHTAFNGL